MHEHHSQGLLWLLPPAAAVARMKEHYDKRNMELNEARLRMAKLPKDGEWRWGSGGGGGVDGGAADGPHTTSNDPELTLTQPSSPPCLPTSDGVEVLYTPGLWVPLVNLHGTYILPGIPRYSAVLAPSDAMLLRDGSMVQRPLLTTAIPCTAEPSRMPCRITHSQAFPADG